MSSGPIVHMHDGGGAALTLDTCSSDSTMSKSSLY